MKLLYRRSNLNPKPKLYERCCDNQKCFTWRNKDYCYTCLIRELYKMKRAQEKRESAKIEKKVVNKFTGSLNEL